MEFTNDSLDKVNEARKVVDEFTAEVLQRAKVWLVANYVGNYELPSPRIIFEQQGWVIKLVNLDKILNDTTGAPVEFVFNHPDLQPRTLTFQVPAASIFA